MVETDREVYVCGKRFRPQGSVPKCEGKKLLRLASTGGRYYQRIHWHREPRVHAGFGRAMLNPYFKIFEIAEGTEKALTLVVVRGTREKMKRETNIVTQKIKCSLRLLH